MSTSPGVTYSPETSTTLSAPAGSMPAATAATLPAAIATSRTAVIPFLGSMTCPPFNSRSYFGCAGGWPIAAGTTQAPTANASPSERAIANEPRERSAPAKRRARERVGESEGRSPSDKSRSLRLRGGRAHDQLRRHLIHVPLQPLAADQAEEGVERRRSHVAGGHPHRCQGRARVPGQRDVVETDDRHILGNAQARSVERVHRAD